MLEFSRIMSRVKNLFSIGTVTGSKTNILQIKTATGKTNDRIKRLNNYGFMSRPLEGSRSYLLFLGGVMSRGVSFCVEDERHEIKLGKGEVAVLDDKGNLIHFTKDGIKLISCSAVDVTAKKDITITTEANIIANGSKIKLNEGSGVITCESICPFMGKAHVDGSTSVFAGKK